jgi:uncharacterized protein (DUF952 family)
VSNADVTYHLAAREVWEAQNGAADYVPEAYARDGFIHCTDGADEVIAVGNRYYRDDARAFVVLVIDKERLRAPWRYDDEARVYPHVYGALNRDAVVGVREIERTGDGAFRSIGVARAGAGR